MGTHREGAELKLMADTILPGISRHFKAYGFEASRESYEQVTQRFADNEQVKIVHIAMCHELPANGKIKLFHSGNGLGDSLYRQGESYEEVEAVRFSDWLARENIDIQNSICLLRMNIEGAESDVINDLIECGLVRHISGFYGMWDDLSKIDIQRDQVFRDLLSAHRIFPITFNGRDVGLPLRMRCIEYDIHTHVQAALLELAKQSNKSDAIAEV